jgi:type IX secretion system PorP/SprF family membrane protein
MKKTLIVLMVMVTCIVSKKTIAQVDPHFTLYYVYPSWINPALTGAFDGELRASAIYRNQWGNVSAPFTTPGVSVDYNTSKKLNFGVNMLRQKAGNGGYSYTTANASLAYTGVTFNNETQRLVFGMQAGLVQKRFDISKLTFGDQWNPVTGITTSTPTAEQLRNNNNSSLDVGAGVMYYDATPNKKANIFAGYSAAHLTKQKDNFSAFGNQQVPVRHTMHGGVRINAGNNFTITPNFLYLKQGSASEKMIGAYGEYKASAKNDFIIGTNYRIGDAITPYVGLTFNNTMLSASYDINVSDLGQLVKGTNSFEISLTFLKKRNFKPTESNFVCPRL